MNPRKIVIIDDDRDQQAGLRVRLIASGYQVAGASDAMQAIAIVRKEKPDLILLDIGLPGGDGHMVFQRLRALTPTSAIPIIVLSAMEPSAHRDRMLKAGASAYFQKPADNAQLLAAIRLALGEADPAALSTPRSERN